MHVRMVWGKLKPGKWDEYESHYNQHIEPATRGQGGFRGRQLLRSTENPDEGLSLTMWDTRESMEDYSNNTQQQQLAKDVETLYTGEHWIKHFELRSSTI